MSTTIAFKIGQDGTLPANTEQKLKEIFGDRLQDYKDYAQKFGAPNIVLAKVVNLLGADNIKKDIGFIVKKESNSPLVFNMQLASAVDWINGSGHRQGSEDKGFAKVFILSPSTIAGSKPDEFLSNTALLDYATKATKELPNDQDIAEWNEGFNFFVNPELKTQIKIEPPNLPKTKEKRETAKEISIDPKNDHTEPLFKVDQEATNKLFNPDEANQDRDATTEVTKKVDGTKKEPGRVKRTFRRLGQRVFRSKNNPTGTKQGDKVYGLFNNTLGVTAWTTAILAPVVGFLLPHGYMDHIEEDYAFLKDSGTKEFIQKAKNFTIDSGNQLRESIVVHMGGYNTPPITIPKVKIQEEMDKLGERVIEKINSNEPYNFREVEEALAYAKYTQQSIHLEGKTISNNGRPFDFNAFKSMAINGEQVDPFKGVSFAGANFEDPVILAPGSQNLDFSGAKFKKGISLGSIDKPVDNANLKGVKFTNVENSGDFIIVAKKANLVSFNMDGMDNNNPESKFIFLAPGDNSRRKGNTKRGEKNASFEQTIVRSKNPILVDTDAKIFGKKGDNIVTAKDFDNSGYVEAAIKDVTSKISKGRQDIDQKDIDALFEARKIDPVAFNKTFKGFKGVRFSSDGVSFVGKNLKGIDFSGAKFNGNVDFSKADLSGARLAGAWFFGEVDLAGVKCSGTDFSDTYFRSRLDLSSGDFSGAMFVNTAFNREVFSRLTDGETKLSASNWANAKFNKGLSLVGKVSGDNVSFEGVAVDGNFSVCTPGSSKLQIKAKDATVTGNLDIRGGAAQDETHISGFAKIGGSSLIDKDTKAISSYATIAAKAQEKIKNNKEISQLDIDALSYVAKKEGKPLNLEGAKIDGNIILAGRDFTKANCKGLTISGNVDVSGAKLDGSDWTGSTIKGDFATDLGQHFDTTKSEKQMKQEIAEINKTKKKEFVGMYAKANLKGATLNNMNIAGRLHLVGADLNLDKLKINNSKVSGTTMLLLTNHTLKGNSWKNWNINISNSTFENGAYMTGNFAKLNIDKGSIFKQGLNITGDLGDLNIVDNRLSRLSFGNNKEGSTVSNAKIEKNKGLSDVNRLQISFAQDTKILDAKILNNEVQKVFSGLRSKFDDCLIEFKKADEVAFHENEFKNTDLQLDDVSGVVFSGGKFYSKSSDRSTNKASLIIRGKNNSIQTYAGNNGKRLRIGKKVILGNDKKEKRITRSRLKVGSKHGAKIVSDVFAFNTKDGGSKKNMRRASLDKPKYGFDGFNAQRYTKQFALNNQGKSHRG